MFHILIRSLAFVTSASVLQGVAEAEEEAADGFEVEEMRAGTGSTGARSHPAWLRRGLTSEAVEGPLEELRKGASRPARYRP